MSVQLGNVDLLNYKEFEVLWKIKAKEYSKRKNITKFSINYLLYIQNFVEWFYLEHLKLTEEQIVEFGFLQELSKIVKTITSTDILTSYIYVAGNNSLSFENGLLEDAYNYSLQLYKIHSSDADIIKNERIRFYKGKHIEYAKKIQLCVPDDILSIRLMHISDKFNFTNKEVKYIQEALTDELDTTIVCDLKVFHKSYVQQMQSLKDACNV